MKALAFKNSSIQIFSARSYHASNQGASTYTTTAQVTLKKGMSTKQRLSLLTNHIQPASQSQEQQGYSTTNSDMVKAKDFEIAIVGGGIAGLTLAIALHHRGVRVAIYEQAPQFGEIGAGVSFSPNAVQAMKVCHEGVFAAFEKVCTRNLWPSKQDVWFDYLDGFTGPKPGEETQSIAFTIRNSLGQNGVHRARFLDEIVKLVPTEIARFGKKLLDICEDPATGRLVMSFEDGSTAEADAIVGCDGIKSRVRQVIVGKDHPSAQPSFSHKYAYRGLAPMQQAIEALGEEVAMNSCMHVSFAVPPNPSASMRRTLC